MAWHYVTLPYATLRYVTLHLFAVHIDTYLLTYVCTYIFAQDTLPYSAKGLSRCLKSSAPSSPEHSRPPRGPHLSAGVTGGNSANLVRLMIAILHDGIYQNIPKPYELW